MSRDAYEELMEEGFAVIPRALDSLHCERALTAIDAFKHEHRERIGANVDEYGHLYRVVNTHLAIDALADAFTECRPALAVADKYFGKPTSLYTTLYYERGSEQPLHRDTPYFYTNPADQYLGMWLALDDVDAHNGALRVVPGSHKLPPIDVRTIARELFPNGATIPPISEEGWKRYQAEVQRQCDELGLTHKEVYVRCGDIIIWHPSMFHGGAPHVAKERSRRSLVMHVTPQGVPVYQIDAMFQPDRPISDRARWRYYQHRDRKIARFKEIDFGHKYVVPVRRWRWPLI